MVHTVHGKILANHTGKSYWQGKFWRISYSPCDLPTFSCAKIFPCTVYHQEFTVHVWTHKPFVLYLAGSCQEFYDPVYCHINSSNCTVYVNQTLTFVCKCDHENCSVRWELNGNSVNGSVEYTVNVTDDIVGVVTCYNDHSPESYQWNVTILQPSKYILLCVCVSLLA